MYLELTFAAMLLQASPPAQTTAPPVQPEQTTPAPQAKQEPSSQEPVKEQVPQRYSETVIVTASRVKESIVDAPASMTVFGSAQIASSPATGVAELLQGIVGLNVIQISAREFQVAGRQPAGVLGQGQLVLLDGRVVNNGDNSMMWDQLPIELDEIDQVEILHGSGSMMWGANAMGAVINLRTKSPRQMQGLRFTGGFGERGVGLGSIRWADATNTISYKVSASYYHHDGWDRPTTLPDGSPVTGFLAYTNPEVYQPKADVRLDYEPSPDRVWSFRAGYAGGNGMLFTNDLPIELTRSFHSNYADVSYNAPSMDGRISWARSSGAFRSLTDRSVTAISSMFPIAEVNFRKAANTHHLLVFGGSTRFDFWDIPIVPKRGPRRAVGGYLEDRVFVNEKVRLNLGARLDVVQDSGPAFSPHAGVLVKPAAGHAVRFSVSRGYRVPTPVESFLDFPSGYGIDLAPGLSVFVPLRVVGNESLHEVRSLGLEAGYTGELAARHTFQATVYRSTASSVIQAGTTEFYSPAQPQPGWPFPPQTVPPSALPKTVSFLNTGEIRSQGVEIALNSGWPQGMWSSGSYTFQAKPALARVAPGFETQVNEPSRHQASGMIGWSRAPWRGSLNIIYAGRAFWADVLATDPRIRGYSDSYVLANVSAAYALPGTRVELILKVSNLLDQQIQQHGFGDLIRRELAGYVRIDIRR